MRLSQVAVAAALAGLASLAVATELEIRFVDPEGRDVRLAKAELLLVAWGAADRLSLPFEGSVLRLDLDPSWLCERWSVMYDSMENAFLLVEADGYAPVRSEPFLWLGAQGYTHGAGVAETTVDFRQGQPMALREGDRADLEVVLRRPQPRWVLLLDEGDRPVAGLRVSSFMFWSHSNHCGVLNDIDPLGEATSDAEGRFPVADRDFEVALRLPDGDWTFVAPRSPYFPGEAITLLQRGETVLRLHRLLFQPLALRVLRDGSPVAGATLMGELTRCGCGQCFGPLGTSDGDGWVRVPALCLEGFESLWLEDAGSRRLWERAAREVPTTPLEVELGAAAAPRKPPRAAPVRE